MLYATTTGFQHAAPVRRPTIANVLLMLSALSYVLLLYFRRPLELIMPGVIMTNANMVTLVIGAFGVLGAMGRRVLSCYRREILYLAAALVIVLASFAAAHLELDILFLALSSVVSTWLTYLIFATVGETSRGFKVSYWALVLCAAMNAGIGLYGTATGSTLFGATRNDVGVAAFGFDVTTGRSGGFVGENYVGIYNVAAFIAGLSLMLHGKRAARLAGAVLAALGGFGTAVGLSRASFATLAVAALVFPILLARKLKLKQMIGALLVAGTFLPLLVFSLPVVENAATTFVAALPSVVQAPILSRWSASGVTADPRYEIWAGYMSEIDNVILGNGPGYIQKRADAGALVPHNSLLDVAVEYGSLGLVLYAGALVAILSQLRVTSARYELAVLYACIWGMLIALMTLSCPFVRPLWVAAGLLRSARNLSAGNRRLTGTQRQVTVIHYPGKTPHRRVRVSDPARAAS